MYYWKAQVSEKLTTFHPCKDVNFLCTPPHVEIGAYIVLQALESGESVGHLHSTLHSAECCLGKGVSYRRYRHIC